MARVLFLRWMKLMVLGWATASWSGCATTPAEPAAEAYPVIDLTQVADGIYPGQAVHRGFTYQVETAIRDHRITGVTIVSNKDSRHGRKAEGVIPLIIEQQKAEVDGISGATYCSTGLKRAVADSLRKAPPNRP